MQIEVGRDVRNARGSAVLRGATFALVAGLAGIPALGAPLRLEAFQDQRVESSFALDFGQGGGVANALIANTAFELEIDGLNETARFVTYNQNIAPILLPGGVDTGAIHVEIVPGSSSGTYNRATGEFTTNELYSIDFEGDLSEFGLVSPVLLPSQSVGIVDAEEGTGGRVTMNWVGSTIVPFEIDYICTLFATFATTPGSYVEVDLMQLLSATVMPAGLRATLMTYLDSAIVYFNAGNMRAAINSLQTFLFKLRISSGSVAQADANALADAANTAIALAENRPTRVMLRTESGLNYRASEEPEGSSKKATDRIVK